MLKIITGENNPALRKKSAPVEKFDNELKKLVKEMEITMLETDEASGEIKGIGLAAPQVGILKRIMLITQNIDSKKPQKIVAMINPEILEVSKEKVLLEEGCLSLPGIFEKVWRPSKAKVRWQNLEGNICEKKLSGFDARIFLHEYDHLEGILFTDYIKRKK